MNRPNVQLAIRVIDLSNDLVIGQHEENTSQRSDQTERVEPSELAPGGIGVPDDTFRWRAITYQISLASRTTGAIAATTSS